VLLQIAAGLILLSAAATAQVRDEQPDMTIDAAARAQIIEGVLKRLNDSYIFPEVAKKMEEAVRARAQKKEYDQITSSSAFARKLTEDLQAVSRDKHLRVRYSHEAIPEGQQRGEPTAEERENYRRFLQRINHGFERVERLPGNIGYIDLRGFFNPELGKDAVAAAMGSVANTDALIFDLRQNGGGDPAMVALISSYLFGSEPVHLNNLHWREGNRVEEFWTKPAAAGLRYEGKDIYVLTSRRTFSGAEEFSYNLKNLKRATIVGETTGGGANPGRGFRINAHFGMFVPTGYAKSPITKTNWEGTGVTPDVDVPKEQALKTAHLMALKKAFDKATDEGAKRQYGQLIEQTQRELDELKRNAKAG
jgi:hypothetical protein